MRHLSLIIYAPKMHFYHVLLYTTTSYLANSMKSVLQEALLLVNAIALILQSRQGVVFL